MHRRSTLPIACVLASFTFLHSAPSRAKDAVPLARAHAHNDYLHQRPLLDALDHGFCSIEADVWASGDELLVAHTLPELRPERILRKLYLAPLAKRCAERDGWVYEPGRSVILLIDFKTEDGPTYPLLAKQLAEFRQLFEPRDPGDGRPKVRPVLAVLSGSRKLETVAADADRLCSVDGRPPDLDSDHSADLIPLVSDSWANHFKWQGVGTMPVDERAKLQALVDRTHSQGRKLRFWGAPATEATWEALDDAGVDLLGTDDLDALQRFLAERQKHVKP
jgi:hypothetical protein